MRKLLKVVIPPFVGFSLYFIAVRYSPYYFTLKPDEMGNGNLQSFMSYYRYCVPLLGVVGILTQLIIAVPVWDSISKKSVSAKWIAFFVLCVICFLLAAPIAYAMWDMRYREHLVKLWVFMTAVQIAYWMINIVLLYIIDYLLYKPVKTEPTV
ncbi:MAG TPA: hypothetical protein VG367_15150 [Mucilaginibacter sp.]|jgi:hypothetical protein|nr:hypothetical protein [Mucilaginibacter sp.]